jgi:hypothetical protein
VSDKAQEQRLLQVFNGIHGLEIYAAGLEYGSQIAAPVAIVLFGQVAK